MTVPKITKAQTIAALQKYVDSTEVQEVSIYIDAVDQPCCIVGRLLADLGYLKAGLITKLRENAETPRVGQDPTWNAQGIGAAGHPVATRFRKEALPILSVLQHNADDQFSWGVAVKNALSLR